MLSVANLAGARGERKLFAGLAFALNKGEWLHVAGGNGAGKTSLLRMLIGLSQPESGEILWDGTPIAVLDEAYRANLLYLGHQTPVKEELSARENLDVMSALKGWELPMVDADAALRRLGLSGREDLPVRFLSQGQRRRVALAQLLVSREPLWFLDEPFVALDEAAIETVAEIIAAHLDAGGIAVLTSHQETMLPAASKRALQLDP